MMRSVDVRDMMMMMMMMMMMIFDFSTDDLHTIATTTHIITGPSHSKTAEQQQALKDVTRHINEGKPDCPLP